MPEPNDKPQDDLQRVRKKPIKKRLGSLGVWAFAGMTLLGGFIGGREIPKAGSSQPSPPVVYVIQTQQEIENLTETVRGILKNAADKKISVEQATLQISVAFRITLANIATVEKIRPIVQSAVDAATDPAIGEATTAALEVYKSMSKPEPSPKPTATIVVPSRR